MKNGNNIADKTTGERIERLRKEKGYVTLTDKNGTEIKQKLTQEYLATHYLNFEGVRQYRNYVNGTTPIPVDRLCVLADLFNVSVDYLLLRTDYTTADNEMISDVLGLTDKSIENIKKCRKEWVQHDISIIQCQQFNGSGMNRTSQLFTYKNTFNYFLSSDFLNSFVTSLNTFLNPQYNIPVDFVPMPGKKTMWYKVNQKTMYNPENPDVNYAFFAKNELRLADNIPIPIDRAFIEGVGLKGVESTLYEIKHEIEKEKAKKKSPKP